LRGSLVLTHSDTPMSDESVVNKLARVRKAFSDYYQVKLEEEDSFILVNGAHVIKFSIKWVEEDWELTLHLVDGTSHTLASDWANKFIRDVFGDNIADRTGEYEIED
jgi:hypothetical protein